MNRIILIGSLSGPNFARFVGGERNWDEASARARVRARAIWQRTRETPRFVFPPGGGYFGNFWVGMCRWDPGTLSLYQS